jgi:hypothetical protein
MAPGRWRIHAALHVFGGPGRILAQRIACPEAVDGAIDERAQVLSVAATVGHHAGHPADGFEGPRALHALLEGDAPALG